MISTNYRNCDNCKWTMSTSRVCSNFYGWLTEGQRRGKMGWSLKKGSRAHDVGKGTRDQKNAMS